VCRSGECRRAIMLVFTSCWWCVGCHGIQ
jgi:hypothetical protein